MRSPSPGSPIGHELPRCARTMMRSASSRTTSFLCSTSRMVLSAPLFQRTDQIDTTGTSSTLIARGRSVEM